MNFIAFALISGVRREVFLQSFHYHSRPGRRASPEKMAEQRWGGGGGAHFVLLKHQFSGHRVGVSSCMSNL